MAVDVANMRRAIMPLEYVLTGWSMYSSSSEKAMISSTF